MNSMTAMITTGASFNASFVVLCIPYSPPFSILISGHVLLTATLPTLFRSSQNQRRPASNT
jgi:hypothetical protein